MYRLSICCALTLPVAVLVAASASAAEPATSRDKEVRDELLRLIDERQEGAFRQSFTIEISDAPTNLPKDYDVLFFGKYTDRVLLRIEVNVRGDKASMERVRVNGNDLNATGIDRGVVPFEPVDRLCRQLAYARLATTVQRPMSDAQISDLWATHVSYRAFQIESREEGGSFSLQTEPNQLLATSISEQTRGLSGFIEAQAAAKLSELASQHLKRAEPDAELGAALVRRLNAIRDPIAGEKKPALRADLAAVEALLYGSLAVEWRVKDAMSELKRLELMTAADQLTIATADDPRPLLQNALRGKNSDLFYYSLRFIMDDESRPHLELLIDTLPEVDSGNVESVLEWLGTANLSEEQFRNVQAFHAASHDKRSRVPATIFLMSRGRGDAYYKELRELALRKRAAPHYLDPEERGRDALFEYSIRTRYRRNESAELARELLDRIPSDAPSDTTGLRRIIYALGRLGNDDDLPRLRRYFRAEESAMASEVIDAIAYIDPDEALPMVRRQIDRFSAREDASYYGNYVGVFLDLLFWQRDMGSAESLLAALEKYREDLPHETSWVNSSELTLRYLLADTLDERVAAATEYVVSCGGLSDRDWRNSVAKQLIAVGADPKDVSPLIGPPADATPRHR